MGNKTVACIIARTVSTRLPLKVLRKVTGNLSIIDFIVQRLKKVKNIDDIYICTSNEPVDDILLDVAEKNEVNIYRGSADKVIERLISVGDISSADNVIRITGDNVFTSYEYLDAQIEIHNSNQLEYTRIIDVPIGATAEVMSLDALKRCYSSIDPSVSEYLMLFMFSPSEYRCGVIRIEGVEKSSHYSVTVDTPDDYVRTRTILEKYEGNSLGIKLVDILSIIEKYSVPNSIYPQGGMIKLPYNKEIEFENFQNDMDRRIVLSNNFMVK